MLAIRYTAWDGTQQIRLSAEKVFEKLSEYLSFTDDVQQALDWLLHQGIEWDPSVRVMGLDDFLEQVRESMRQRYQEVSLRDALRDIQRRLDELLDVEREVLDGLADRERGARKRERLDDLPPRLSEALERLRGYDFEDAGAAADYEALLEELEGVRSVEEFQRRYGDLFHGPRSLSFEEALDLMHEMERWRRLEEQLLSGDLGAIDLDMLGAMLGDESLRSFQALRGIMTLLVNAGYLTPREGKLHLSPQGVRKVGQLALRDIYQGLLKERAGTHQTDHGGIAQLRPEQTRRYRYGDPLEIDLVGTLKNAVRRRPSTPLELAPDDFEVFAADHATTTSTVLLLDMSWSMSWEGRFAAAKKVAMAMESLVRTRYPRDYFAIVGFFTRATELKLRDLPEASWNMGDPFTNLQDGLRLAADLLARHPSSNQHIIVITDGQPTAYFLNGRLYCEWPLSFGGISMRAAQETLREVERVTRRGITINTFMLDDSPSLRAFVERMTRINKGRALYTRPDRLGQYLLVDYLAKKRKRV
ncbi:MAG: VWA domain-containing protein [Candidatus Binatia bacterium]